ncbi:MAG: hypothetical protein ABWZ52_11965 [Acidimicrobiales bacterium]
MAHRPVAPLVDIDVRRAEQVVGHPEMLLSIRKNVPRGATRGREALYGRITDVGHTGVTTMIIDDTGGLGRVEVSTIPMPAFAKELSVTYTFSGSVVVLFRRDDDPEGNDFWNVAVADDDGAAFRVIFSGVIRQHEKANGIRLMPFQDNTRLLLGDYVLECDPDIDGCERAELVPVTYPWDIEQEPHTSHHWSEIIIAPDNEHMAWTMLRTDVGAANALGSLVRKQNAYVIESPQIISTLTRFERDEERDGFIVPQVVRGGEVKQFVRGGTAISLVGKKDGPVVDSVVQDLASEELTQITKTPGYDETTIFSPDESLGLVMSTRGSRHTDPAIFGLLPRPHSYATQGLIMALYMYSVAGVRSFRPGNIGPALIEIERSMYEPGYQGVLLNDPEERWVYLSPMSWHPGGKKAMWPEMVRGSNQSERGPQIRVRRVTLHDHQPGDTVPVQRTPDRIPYGIEGTNARLSVWSPPATAVEGRIAGKHSGHVEYTARDAVQSRYDNHSDDGKTFYNGIERLTRSPAEESVYEADLEMTGEQHGAMKLRATFSRATFTLPPKLLFDAAEDGKPKSHGYATYGGVTLNMEDLAE